MKIRKKLPWKPLISRPNTEQRIMRFAKFAMKASALCAAVAISRMSESERAQLLASLTEPLAVSQFEIYVAVAEASAQRI